MIVHQKILVTGANGQLGKELRQLAPLFPQFDFIFLAREELAVENRERVIDVLRKEKPHYLVNCAAYTAVDKAEQEKENAMLVNATATGILAEACREFDCLFIHISTDYVFDGNSRTPYKENDKVNPRSVYGASKLKGEELAFEYNPETIIIRTSWVYSEYGKNFVKTMLRLMAEKNELTVVNDQYGSPTCAVDLAELIMEIISSGKWKPGIYHFSNEGHISWFDFALAIKQLTGSSCNINPVPASAYPTAAQRPAYSVLNTEKIQQVYGARLKPWKLSLKECLARIDIQSGIN